MAVKIIESIITHRDGSVPCRRTRLKKMLNVLVWLNLLIIIWSFLRYLKKRYKTLSDYIVPDLFKKGIHD